MDYDVYENNEALMVKLNEYTKEKYPGLSRDILYAKKNTFNQDFSGNVFLIEVGGNNNNFKTMFDSEGNMHMISGEGDIKYDSFTGRFFNDTGSGSLKQDPVTGDMWFDNGNFMEYINRNRK